MNEKTKAITNLIIAVVLLINAILTAMGKNPLPFNESEVTGAVAYLASGIDLIWVWWKNQNISDEAASLQGTLKQMKANRGKVGGEQ